MIFSAIKGQSKALAKIEKYIKSARIPSTFVFSGTEGVGKKTAAVEFAKYLNCLSPKESEKPCSICDDCLAIAKGLHPFVVLINIDWQTSLLGKELGELGIDAIREVQRLLSLKTNYGKKRVVIIDDAQKLSKEAANSFLKTLEEPPSDTIIILVCISRKNLPPTILSRAQFVEFASLDETSIVQVLMELAPTQEKVLLENCALLSDGSLSRALWLNENWSELSEEKQLFYSAEFNALKDADLSSLFSFLAADYRKAFESNPAMYLEIWEAFMRAKKQIFQGVNKNMILTELHSILPSADM